MILKYRELFETNWIFLEIPQDFCVEYGEPIFKSRLKSDPFKSEKEPERVEWFECTITVRNILNEYRNAAPDSLLQPQKLLRFDAEEAYLLNDSGKTIEKIV